MCSAAKCPKCGKTTWTGCGSHVDQVMASVAPANRCKCNPQTTAEARASKGGGFLSNLFGGR
ncbi:hypothetical protein CKALI_08505 [Corynebacterium kalinowskii]|uniref:Uncharacterized protein n=1 Tax=Corynebacterium kalinowskii TaxID=2675216 RepID=A0A6B8VRR7_9CORY|nr:hypothetical protein [Corynebacterium kalinowskii]QGU02561.1 hypothetical protein CKALI_08505 [Corynebacterium kalinowskii]